VSISQPPSIPDVGDMPAEPPIGSSVWERELFAHLTSHGQMEGALLEEYRRAAEGSQSKALTYLVNILIEDELRHHRVFAELAQSLKSDAELSGDPVIPRMDFDRVDGAAVLEVTDRLLQREKKDSEELKRLQRELRDVEDTTLWGVLVDVMRHDTQKHIAILQFVKRHTKPRRR
jgi:hypothetical protein